MANAGEDALSGAATGASIGSVIPGLGTVAGAAIGGVIGIAPSLFKLFSGSSQKKQANAINPVDPGYRVNQNVLDNANILKDRYTNYTLPGYNNAQNNINSTYADAFAKGTQGASSGTDISDLAAKLAYGKNIAQNNLEAQNAQGKDAALAPYIQANAAAGQEYQNQNIYDQNRYQQELRQKAALTQAGNTNEYNAIDTGASVLSSYFNPKQVTASQGLSGTSSSSAKKLQSIFDSGASPNITGPQASNNDWQGVYDRYSDLNNVA